ncbi:MAG: hypothetical protein J3Q66DRAFT_386551 [Benniella sp.]|nr:MAG: hypothetical protein J3Q66DRAFT_386551 [Benniella sp.]
MNNDAFGPLLRERNRIVASGVDVSTPRSHLDLISCLGSSVPVYDLPLQGTEIPSNAAVLAQAFNARHTLEHQPTLPHINSPLPLHPPPNFLSLHSQVLTLEAPQPMQLQGLQPVYHQNHWVHLVQTLQMQLAQSQQQKEQLQSQLEWQDRQIQQIQHLQWQLMHHHQQQPTDHPQQQPNDAQASPPSQPQQLLSQQFSMVENDPQLLMLPSLVHYSVTQQEFVPAAVNCITNEAEHQDRVEVSSRTEGKRHPKRLTDEQSRDIISRLEGEDPESYQTIANDIGCSKSTVWRQRQKHLRQTKLVQKEDSP